MSWNVQYVPESGFVQFTVVGHVTGDEFTKATIEGIGLAKEKSTKLFLIDDSRWEGGASVVSLYDLPALYAELGVDRGSRAALVSPPSASAEVEDVQFYRTVCKNRGWHVEVFQEREQAIDWLTNA